MNIPVDCFGESIAPTRLYIGLAPRLGTVLTVVDAISSVDHLVMTDEVRSADSSFPNIHGGVDLRVLWPGVMMHPRSSPLRKYLSR